MTDVAATRPLRYRSIWISDVHLGSRNCQAGFVLDFLKSTECEYLYLVGDIVDLWAMKKGIYWPQTHNDIVRLLLDKARDGTRVTYVPGNHDEVLRDYADTDIMHVAVRRETYHDTADGRSFMILHGDKFDQTVQDGRWSAVIGARAYGVLIGLHRRLSDLRRRFGLGYWSLAAFIKHKMKNAVEYIAKFEQAVALEARSASMQGVICGHIHHAAMRDIDGVLYCNCGDWIESCTALVEHPNGRIELLRWTDEQTVAHSDRSGVQTV